MGSPKSTTSRRKWEVFQTFLKEGYRANGKDLSEYISDVRNRLPHQAKADKLHQIRIRANVALHLGERKSPPNIEVLETQTMDDLITLRHLIEGIRKR